MSAEKILIRADAGVAMGTGHVMRCLALAQAWRDAGGDAVFVMAESTPSIVDRVKAGGIATEIIEVSAGSDDDARSTASLAHAHRVSWVVIDGYAFDQSFHAPIRATGPKVLCIDDSASERSISADIILNQNLHSGNATYLSRSAKTERLLGPRFALIRREFQPWRARDREVLKIAKRILVTMGGSDPLNLSARVISALASLPKIEIKVVVGGSNPRVADLKGRVPHHVQVVVDSKNMAELMAWADMAVAAAGSTCWELCMLGVPAIVIDTAANQLPLAQDLARCGIVRHITLAEANAERIAFETQHLIAAGELRSSMSRLGMQLVDGRGAARVVAAMQSCDYRLRHAQERDCQLLWEWANDSDVRRSSFSSSLITWPEHCAWFEQKLNDPRDMILIFQDSDGTPIGTIRFHQTSECDFQVGVTIAPPFRRRNYAPIMLKQAMNHLFSVRDARRVHAFIKKENVASRRSFENAGFVFSGCETVKGIEALHYVLLNEVRAQMISQSSLEGEATSCR